MNEHSSKARSRIEALLDAQSFVEIGALVKSRSIYKLTWKSLQ